MEGMEGRDELREGRKEGELGSGGRIRRGERIRRGSEGVGCDMIVCQLTADHM
jgi:hypothetical protein